MLKKCLKCDCVFDDYSKWGPKKFCSRKCANSREQSPELRKRKSLKLIGRIGWARGLKQPKWVIKKRMSGYTPEKRMIAVQKVKEQRQKKYENTSFENLKRGLKRRRVIEEQKSRCLHCGLNEWLGKPLMLELDHIDGHKKNEGRENLRILCPNCHSQTPTFRNSKRL